ncbi:hypothetical protein AVEN_204759-1 [Araneus ventricosus]|uniref:Uncharacterized protein n=1 Tax=Araneus ventricosus TaxID=182803 RepID=A0A4Y2FYY3_ARAVE|nr:hypothetical protein AVEN_204759-1 [Araneus ventricosus]
MAKLQPQNSVFQAELLAIHEAIIWAIEQTVVCNIWSYTISSLLALKSLKTINKTVRTLLSHHRNITINWIKVHSRHLGNEKADQLSKRSTLEGTAFNLRKPISFLKKTLTQLSLESWQRQWEEGKTSCHTFDA